MATNQSASTARPSLSFDQESQAWLEPFLPGQQTQGQTGRPFVTLTYAQSLDSSLASAPGVRTTLSGAETKAMTHYLRSRHDAILVGIGTVLADNPALNCRLNDAVGNLDKQPRPVVLDPWAKWKILPSECWRLAQEGSGKAPWVVRCEEAGLSCFKREDMKTMSQLGGKYLSLSSREEESTRLSWQDVLAALHDEGIRSVMIEGGASIINSLLGSGDAGLIDSVIVTIAPTWLGAGGVLVNPPRPTTQDGETAPSVRLQDTRWRQFGEDVVVCGHIKR